MMIRESMKRLSRHGLWCAIIMMTIFICKYKKLYTSICDKNYWDNNLTTMLDHYINKPEDVLVLEKKKDAIVFDCIKRVNPITILEIGCGFGYTTKKIAERFSSTIVYGSDYSESLVEGAKKYCKNCIPEDKFFVADARTIKHAKVDVIVTHGCLTCLQGDEVEKALLVFKSITDNLVLVEAGFSRFGKDYAEKCKRPVNDYEQLLQKAGWCLVQRYDDFAQEQKMSYSSIFWVQKQ